MLKKSDVPHFMFLTIGSQFFWISEVLGLSNNKYVGSLPTEMGRLEAMKDISLKNNSFTGFIPNEIRRMTNLGKALCRNIFQCSTLVSLIILSLSLLVATTS